MCCLQDQLKLGQQQQLLMQELQILQALVLPKQLQERQLQNLQMLE